ncbi:hypothetical protein [Nocardia goodfellowii]|uniref:PPE family protein n=1 Tax=Nocardia goodfellowii TaxID=882446 RepID=A0ABS4QPM5_9NOCA|nr:hypothetical protein [Nocardia goodfellowii]MBP2193671.1 hypothetical protein [Nocardia goodfellowii]
MADGDGEQTAVDLTELLTSGTALGWGDLSTIAQEQGQLLVDNGAAYSAATAFNEAIGQLMGIDNGAQWMGVGVDRVAGLNSWLTAMGKVNLRTIALTDALDGMRGVMSDIYDTLVAAGKAYEAAEEVSAAGFDSLTAPTMTMDLPFISSNESPFSWTGGEKPEGLSDGLRTQVPESVLPASLGPLSDDADNMSWDQLFDVGQSIRDNNIVSKFESTAERWWQMANLVEQALLRPRERLAAITAESWQGAGATAAVAAVDTFMAESGKTVDAVRLTGDLIHFIAEWAGKTENAMPAFQDYSRIHTLSDNVTQIEGEWMRPYAVDDFLVELDNYREAFRANYVENILLTDKSIPEIPIPPNPTVGDLTIPDLTPNENPGGTDYADPGGGGGLDAGGGGLDPDAFEPDAWPGNASPSELPADQAPTTHPAGSDTAPADRTPDQDSTGWQQSAQQAAQQGMSALEQLAQQGSQTLQEALQNSGGMPLATNPLASVPTSLGQSTAPLAGWRPSGMSSGAGAASDPGNTRSLADAAKLFPRASVSGTDFQTAGRTAAGGAQYPTAGSPGATGSPGAAARGKDDERHKRPMYLESAEHIEEAIGQALETTRPVAGATNAPAVSSPAHAIPVVVPDRTPAPEATAQQAPTPQRPAPQTVPVQ